MKSILTLIFLVILASCNTQLTGDIVDRSQFNSDSSETISNIKISNTSSELMLDIDYVDHENRYRNEKSAISLYNSESLKGLRKSFNSFTYGYSGELHCLNMDCSNTDIDVIFDRDQTKSKSIKIAKREYPISSSAIKFYPNENQSRGDVLFDAQMIQKSAVPQLMLSLIQIQGVRVPLFQISTPSNISRDSAQNLSLKSNGVNSSVTFTSNKSEDFKILDYKNDRTGSISMTLQNYSGTIVIDTYR